MKNQKRNKRIALLMALTLSTGVLFSAKPARAETPQETIFKMALDAAKSFGGEKLKAWLFPQDGIDYDRIRKDMEEVTRRRIAIAEADRVLGRIAGASQNARIDVLDDDALNKLNDTRKTLVLDISGITKGDYQVPGIGNYVLGAQVEMSILAAMLEKTPPPVSAAEELENEAMVQAGQCGRDCVLKALEDRVKTHADHLNATVKLITDDAMNAAVDRVTQCQMDYEIIDIAGRPHKKDIGYNFVDKARDYSSEHTWDRNRCEQDHSTYIGMRKNDALKQVVPQLKWMYAVRASWAKSIVNAIPAKAEEAQRAALMESAPAFFIENSACYTQLRQAMERNPSVPACKVFRDVTSDRGICPLSGSGDVYQQLFETVGCQAK